MSDVSNIPHSHNLQSIPLTFWNVLLPKGSVEVSEAHCHGQESSADWLVGNRNGKLRPPWSRFDVLLTRLNRLTLSQSGLVRRRWRRRSFLPSPTRVGIPTSPLLSLEHEQMSRLRPADKNYAVRGRVFDQVSSLVGVVYRLSFTSSCCHYEFTSNVNLVEGGGGGGSVAMETAGK